MTTDLDRVTAALAGRHRPERELSHGGMVTVYPETGSIVFRAHNGYN